MYHLPHWRMLLACHGQGVRRVAVLQATADPWLQTLQAYLKGSLFKTTTATTLWDAFRDSTGEEVADWMHPWTYRPGYPIVTVALGGANGLDVMVSQVRTCRLPPSGGTGTGPVLSCSTLSQLCGY